jgi:hypothetical protein
VTGALLAAPLGAEAQQAGKSYRVCFVALTPGEDTTSMKPLLERLRELGYTEGKNMTFEYQSAEGHSERLPELAMELVRGRPDVLIAGFGTLTAQAAKAATMTIPIVFTTVGDPVGAGLVASLGRPGGNVTGLSGLTEVGGKHLQLLQELSPGKEVIAVLMNPETPFTRLALKEIKTAAEASRIRLVILEARTAAGAPRVPGGGHGRLGWPARARGSVDVQPAPRDCRPLGEVPASCGVPVQGMGGGGRVGVLRCGSTSGIPIPTFPRDVCGLCPPSSLLALDGE